MKLPMETALDLWRDTTKPVTEISELTGLSVSTIRKAARTIPRPGVATRRKAISEEELSPTHILIGEELRKARVLTRGWTLQDLAKASGFSTSRIVAVEQGRADLRISDLDVLLSALELDIEVTVTSAKD